MYVLRWLFRLLTVCGCWQPHVWTSPWRRKIYVLYTTFILLLVHSLSFSQFMDIILNVNNSDDFADNFYMLLSISIACCKMYSLLLNRNNIAILSNILKRDPCKPINAEETKLQKKYDQNIRNDIFRYAALVETSVAGITLMSLQRDFKEKKLLFRAWLPYDYHSSMTLFCVTYIHQIMGMLAASLLHVASDGLICGFLVHTCNQIALLEYRLKNILNNKQDILYKCIRHHDCIYKFATMINKKFKTMIFVQFSVSTLVLCFNLYRLTEIEMFSSRFIQVIMYTFSMLTQIFYYCRYGNEVKLKVSDTIFALDWTSLDTDSKKSLLMIMKRSTVPIEFTSMAIISMNLDSFISLLKTSYSAYNLLQQT